MQPLRPYQHRAVAGVRAAWAAGERAVLLVAPTGAGKTRLAEELIHGAKTAVVIVHRRELLRQMRARLSASLGAANVGLIAPGEDASPHAPVQVATVQTLLARDMRPPAELVVLDEAHHYVATDWLAVHEHYTSARVLGLTATPQRQDGTALGDVFERLVVAAKYSELVADGYLVPSRVYQPPSDLGANLALDPVVAWQRYGEGQTFAFLPSVQLAVETAAAFRLAGIPAAYVTGSQSRRDRDAALEDFSAGRVRVLCNYNVLTEGVDVPAARTLLIGRSFTHVGAYIQAAGRVLRPHPSKQDALIIDLTGATLRHGFPTDDREYSLDGRGITREKIPPLRQCLQCAATLHASVQTCPACGYVFTCRDPRIPRVYSLELREVYAGSDTPDEAKAREYQRLRDLQRARGHGIGFVVSQYRKLFGAAPVIRDATHDERAAELARLKKIAEDRGYKRGFAAVRYREMFGSWPS